MLWIAFTLTASVAQTARNAMQRDLIASIGAAGATYVRFLFGLPFALAFLGLAAAALGAPPPPPPAALAWIFGGALAQILATLLMLSAMREKSFVVATAYTKTEPVLVALFGLAFLGDGLTFALALAIGLATAGVLLMSWPKRGAGDAGALRPALYGIASAGCFALSAIGYRGGILSLAAPSFILNASTALALGLAMQSSLILALLLASDRAKLRAIGKAWRPSLLAGFMGAFASQFWFLAFAVALAAQVRTLALVEVILAQIVSQQRLRQRVSRRETAGMALILIGVAIMLNG